MAQNHSTADNVDTTTLNANNVAGEGLQQLQEMMAAAMGNQGAAASFPFATMLSVLLNTNQLHAFLSAVFQIVLNNTMADELTRHLQASQYARSPSRQGYRNGYRLTTVSIPNAGVTTEVKVPKTRSGSFNPPSLEKVRNAEEKALCSVVAELYVSGVSTRKVKHLLEVLGLEGVSSSTVSSMCEELDKQVREFRMRPLTKRYPIVYVDATYVNIKTSISYESRAIVIAAGVNEEGKREIIGFDAVPSEKGDFWTHFIRQLKERGLAGVKLVVSDANQGIKNAVKKELCCAWQRCEVHFDRNVYAAINKKAHMNEIKPLITQLHGAATKGQAHETIASLVKRLDELNEHRAAKICEEGEADILTYMDFPESMWKKLRTNNLMERSNLELKRRYKAIGLFPSDNSAIRLFGAILMRYNQEWADRRYMSAEAIAKVLDMPK